MEVDFPVSPLIKQRDDALVPRCRNIRETGQENLRDLADYDVTAANPAGLQAAIDDYSATVAKPRAAITQRRMSGETLEQLFEANDAILKDRMDRLVQTFRAAHPDFVRAYEATRRIIKPPHTATQLKGIITDQTTGAPVKNVTVTATPATPEPTAPNDPIPLTALSDAAGEYSFKPLPHDTYTVTVTAFGFNNFEADNVDVKLGEINNLDVELVK